MMTRLYIILNVFSSSFINSNLGSKLPKIANMVFNDWAKNDIAIIWIMMMMTDRLNGLGMILKIKQEMKRSINLAQFLVKPLLQFFVYYLCCLGRRVRPKPRYYLVV